MIKKETDMVVALCNTSIYIANKFIEKVAIGKAISRETYNDMLTLKERAQKTLAFLNRNN
jgi:hypothetical protein